MELFQLLVWFLSLVSLIVGIMLVIYLFMFLSAGVSYFKAAEKHMKTSTQLRKIEINSRYGK